jgi:Rrf2 family protein
VLTSNTHFTIAVHVLTALALHEGRPVSSSLLAESVHTNASFLRAVLGRLRRAGLLETKRGKGGGSTLASAPEEITLLDIYRATEGEATLQSHDCSGGDCPVAMKMPGVLARISGRLDHVVAAELGTIHMADIVRQVQSTASPCRVPPVEANLA